MFRSDIGENPEPVRNKENVLAAVDKKERIQNIFSLLKIKKLKYRKKYEYFLIK